MRLANLRVGLVVLIASAAVLLPRGVRAECSCDLIYSVDAFGSGLYEINPHTQESRFIGNTTWTTSSSTVMVNMYDIAMTPEGRLFGVPFNFGGEAILFEIDCDTAALTELTTLVPGTHALAGVLPGEPVEDEVYWQGPPLRRTETDSPHTTTVVGGVLGTAPGEWCGASWGDLAMHPDERVFYSTLDCPTCPFPAPTLVVIDPADGSFIREVGCIVDCTSGVPYPDIYGLAFDSNGVLWGGSAHADTGLLKIDPATGLAEAIPITGGYSWSNGLASLPCSQSCHPLTQGFWKRQCKGGHPSGEDQRLESYVDCVNDAATFAAVTSAADICDHLHPSAKNDKCEQARAQFMALLLNTCSGRASENCCIEGAECPVTLIEDAIEEIDALLSTSPTVAECEAAQSLAASINEGTALCN